MMDLVFSDIHADIFGLESILDMASSDGFVKKYGSFSRIINLGDILERGTHPKEVISKLQSLEKNYPVISVMGNHDEAFLYNRLVGGNSIESMNAHAKLTGDEMAFFKQNKDGTFGIQQFIDKKNKMLCVHGGPLDPKKITPKDARSTSWLYQRPWQRLTSEDAEFISYSGYHYVASSAFGEAKNLQCNVILCGHQHSETVIVQDGKINEVYPSLKVTKEKISKHVIEKREIEIKSSLNYLIRLGLGGPEGNYGAVNGDYHFGIVQYNPTKVILFTVKP